MAQTPDPTARENPPSKGTLAQAWALHVRARANSTSTLTLLGTPVGLITSGRKMQGGGQGERGGAKGA
eukprot:9411769-Alexandrium_andersonii.AAC.1